MRKLLAILLLSITFVSCEKLIMKDPVGSTPTEVFETLWKTIDEGYVYFEYNPIEWDSVYSMYKDKIIDTMSDEELFDTCAMMLRELKDPNIVLKSSFAERGFTDTQVYRANFNRYLLERNYWGDYHKTGPFIHTVIDSTGYVYYESFEEEITNAQLDIIIEGLRLENDSIKGVVFDIRDNDGGDVENLFTLMRRMGVDTTFTLTAIMYKAYFKDGPEHDDITEPEASFIEQITKTKFPKQFILLTNRKTRGTAALFAAAATGHPNVRVYGDTTGGGTGRVVGGELPNGWIVEYPASYFTTDDDKLIERGVAPSQTVHMKADDEANGKDTILEEALKKINDE